MTGSGRMPTAVLAQMRTCLYRVYSGSDRLLYVGISIKPDFRSAEHAFDKAWWDEVDHSRTRLAWYSTRAEALAAEREAIRAERPLYNVAHHPDARRGDAKARRRVPGTVKPRRPELAEIMERIRKASDAYLAILADQERRREHLHAAIVRCLEVGIKPSEIERLVPYDRQHINRIRKLAGLPPRRPATVQRIPKDD